MCPPPHRVTLHCTALQVCRAQAIRDIACEVLEAPLPPATLARLRAMLPPTESGATPAVTDAAATEGGAAATATGREQRPGERAEGTECLEEGGEEEVLEGEGEEEEHSMDEEDAEASTSALRYLLQFFRFLPADVMEQVGSGRNQVQSISVLCRKMKRNGIVAKGDSSL